MEQWRQSAHIYTSVARHPVCQYPVLKTDDQVKIPFSFLLNVDLNKKTRRKALITNVIENKMRYLTQWWDNVMQSSIWIETERQIENKRTTTNLLVVDDGSEWHFRSLSLLSSKLLYWSPSRSFLADGTSLDYTHTNDDCLRIELCDFKSCELLNQRIKPL